MPSNFVIIKKHKFEEALSEIFSDDWEEITQQLNGTKESVYQINLQNDNVAIRIYSSIDTRTAQSRDIGEDAIRIVVWDKLNDRPIGKTKRINRTEGATSVYDRIQKRIKEFMTTSHEFQPINWDYVRAVLDHNSWNNFAQSLRNGLDTYGSLTEKQLMYVLGSEPVNERPTMEMRAKQDNPNFFARWQERQALNTDHAPAVSGATDNASNCVLDSFTSEAQVRASQALAADIRNRIRSPTGRRARVVSGVGVRNTRTVDLSNPETFPQETSIHEIMDDILEPPEEEEVELIGTNRYLDYIYPFDHFNPIQTTVLPLRGKDINLVIGAATSAGKTICAELMMDHTLKNNQKVIYLSPLKALTQEKYDDWKMRYREKKIVILTGDYTLSEAMKKKLGQADIIVMTSEMMDSRTRRMKMEHGDWLRAVGLVVVDESHIIATDRGHAVEVGLMRFTRINPWARVVLLSATMPNVEDMGEWLHKLNGKQTEIINSQWRPVELEINFIIYEVVRSQYGGMNYTATQNNKINQAVQIANSKIDEKFLIFVHDKTTGRRLVKALQQTGCDTIFHNADLDLSERLDIERSFEDRDSGTRVLVSTSTLAWGRNLPARNVIVVGCHRGIDEVHEYDLIQMAGRAGRYGIDDMGFVFLLIPDNDQIRWTNKFYEPRPLQSTLHRPELLAFHAITEIDSNEVRDPGTLKLWFNRSFAANTEPMPTEEAAAVFLNLIDMEMIKTENLPRPKITGLGKVCSWLYFSPFDVYHWYKNINEVHEDGHLVDDPDTALAYSISNAPTFDYGYIPKDCKDEVEPLQMGLLTGRGYHRLMQGTGAYFLGILAALEGREKADIPISARTTGRSIKWDIRRITQAIKLIDSMHADWKLDPIWKTLPLRIQHGVSAEISELCRIPNVGGMRAKKLWAKGFKTIEDIADPTKTRKLRLTLQPKLAKKIQAAARDILTEIEN